MIWVVLGTQSSRLHKTTKRYFIVAGETPAFLETITRRVAAGWLVLPFQGERITVTFDRHPKMENIPVSRQQSVSKPIRKHKMTQSNPIHCCLSATQPFGYLRCSPTALTYGRLSPIYLI
ncbi:MAG: hypothetical protein LBG58_13915 [Planctomycetaceae bacterium]|nr:hypothetical protein [Planctomycetaceae bacterium]